MTVTDQLNTILRLVELNTYLKGFSMIVGAIEKATEAYVAYDTATLRTQFFLNEFGHSLPTQAVADFARTLSLAAGESQTDIVTLMGYLARFGASSADIERAAKVILNASQATGVGMEELAHGIEKARQGHARLLWGELGIQVKGVEGQLYSLNQIIDIVDKHTKGFSEQFADTLPGAIKRTSAAMEDLNLQFGRLFSPATAAVVEFFRKVIEGWALAFKAAADALGIALPQLQGAAGAGHAQNRTDQYLQQIAFNTGAQGPLGRALRSGGSFNEPGGGLQIRDFNAAFKHGGAR